MGFGFPFFTCKNQNCTKNQSVWLFRLYFGVFSCHRFYITFKSTALWKLSDIKILPNYSFSREIRGLSDMNFITAWNLTGIIETWYKWLNWLNYFYFFIFMRRGSGGGGGGGGRFTHCSDWLYAFPAIIPRCCTNVNSFFLRTTKLELN